MSTVRCFTSFKSVLAVVGDTHGNYQSLVNKIERLDLRSGLILHVGDWGLGFRHPYDDLQDHITLAQQLRERDLQLFIIRGNHDCPYYFHTSVANDIQSDYSGLVAYYNSFSDQVWTTNDINSRQREVEILQSEWLTIQDAIMLVVDNSWLLTSDYNFYFLGGALSVDRSLRQVNRDYWPEEAVNPDLLVERPANLIGDMVRVVTHTAPLAALPNSRDRSFLDRFSIQEDKEVLYDELYDERSLVTGYGEQLTALGLTITHWYYGHYHTNLQTVNGDTSYIGLDIDEFYPVYG